MVGFLWFFAHVVRNSAFDSQNETHIGMARQHHATNVNASLTLSDVG
jgi:hypothetical protein